jgi:hypothetical protein
MSNKPALPALAVAKATKKTFDQSIKFTPVLGEASKKLPFSPTTAVIGALALGFFTGGLWTVSKALVLGGIGFHTWFLNSATKNNKTKKTAICAGLFAAFLYF